LASRRIDAEASADSAWHELGRALIAQGVPLASAVTASVELREFGQRRARQRRAGAPRIAKTYELLAFLAARRPPQASATSLLDALFAGRSDDSARAYLPPGRALAAPGAAGGRDRRRQRTVRLSEEVADRQRSSRFERQLAESARLQGDERLGATLEALAIFDRGDYLPGAALELGRRAPGAARRPRRRRPLRGGRAGFAGGAYDQRGRWSRRRSTRTRSARRAWRLAMRISDTLGDEKGVIRAYHDCERVLARLDTTPSPSTASCSSAAALTASAAPVEKVSRGRHLIDSREPAGLDQTHRLERAREAAAAVRGSSTIGKVVERADPVRAGVDVLADRRRHLRGRAADPAREHVLARDLGEHVVDELVGGRLRRRSL